MTKAEIKTTAAGYQKHVEWSGEDGCFVGRCPALFAGGVHGDEEAEVHQLLCDTSEEWVGLLLRDGVPLPAL